MKKFVTEKHYKSTQFLLKSPIYVYLDKFINLLVLPMSNIYIYHWIILIFRKSVGSTLEYKYLIFFEIYEESF